MQHTKKVQVVLLPTENKRRGNYITVDSVTGKLAYQPFNQIAWSTPQHIYLTNSDTISEGDWWYCIIGTYGQERTIGNTKPNVVEHELRYYKKIIATTNPECQLPSIPESFIQQYVESNGSIKEVEVLMDEIMIIKTMLPNGECSYDVKVGAGLFKLKLTDKNEVVIAGFNGIVDKWKDDNIVPHTPEKVNHLLLLNIESEEQVMEDAAKCLKENNLPLEGDFYEGFLTGSKFGWQARKETNLLEKANNLLAQSFEGWTQDAIDGYYTAIGTLTDNKCNTME